MKSKSVAIIHLVWVPLGIGLFEKFINSFSACDPLEDSELIIVFAGVENRQEITPFIELKNNMNIAFEFYIRNQGQDLETYFWIANKIGHPVLLFFNSYSTLNSKKCLNIFVDNFKGNMGMLSATASNQSHYSSVFANHTFKYEFDKSIGQNFKKLKLLTKNLLYWRLLFTPYPNPHLRTNGFMIRRDVMLQLKIRLPIKNKFAAYLIESGKNSITNQILKMGLEVGMVGKSGNCYRIADWPTSHIFWKGNQEDLLVSDNQTNIYSGASQKEKSRLKFLAWGKS